MAGQAQRPDGVTSSTVAERIRALRLVGSQGLKILRRGAARPLRLITKFRGRTPERLVIAPQDVRTADPTAAADIYAGYYALAGKIVNVHDRSPFEIESPPAAWAAALAGFGWLRHLRAADTALARANARVLVEDWIATHGAPDRSQAWESELTARRLLSWLSQSPLILQGADGAFYRRFMRALSRHANRLEQALREGLDGQPRLVALIALAEFGLCAAGLDAMRRRATRLLEEEIGKQILPDGGHVSRNPQALIDLLLDLLPLRQIYATRGAEPPRLLFNAMDRMGPMLRLFRHSDGDLALFNGMGATRPDDLATVLAYDDVRAKPVLNAPWSGYQRIEAEGCVVVVDAGKPPPPEFSQEAHAGALAFEMSCGTQRLIVNCGAPTRAREDLREASRATAAHSTLTVADLSSSRFADHAGLGRWLPGQIIAGPTAIETRRSEDALTTTLEASHNGYEPRFGLIHRRRLRVFKDGRRLEGEDILQRVEDGRTGDSGLDYALRFHLHPSTRTSLAADAETIELTLQDGQQWVFQADGASANIEESIFFASPHGARPSRQIVLHRRLNEANSQSWSFERLASTERPDI